MDRDTAGVAGSPSISDSIFAKVAQADVFVADVTIVNPRAKGKPTANPNVLVELGFAVASLGWERIILIQNAVHGSPNKLPFDLRGRRIVTYKLAADASNRAETRGILQGRLEEALRSALADSMFVGSYAGLRVPIWWGIWNIESGGAAWGGHLFIREVGPAGFLFEISTYSGAHNGQLNGFARLVSPDLAYARIPQTYAKNICELSFRRSFNDTRRMIEIEERAWCHDFHGMGATFNGTFNRQHDGLFDSGALDEMDLQRLYSIAGQYYSGLASCFQLMHKEETLDPFQATGVVGAPRGLFTIMEAIVMRGRNGELWAAFIDDNVVRYFTTEYEFRERLPITMEHWRERFKDKAIVFAGDVRRIPKS